MPRFAHALTLLVATGFAMPPALASAKEHAGHDAAKPAMAGHAMPGMVHAKAVDAAGKDIGMVMLEQTPGGVLNRQVRTGDEVHDGWRSFQSQRA